MMYQCVQIYVRIPTVNNLGTFYIDFHLSCMVVGFQLFKNSGAYSQCASTCHLCLCRIYTDTDIPSAETFLQAMFSAYHFLFLVVRGPCHCHSDPPASRSGHRSNLDDERHGWPFSRPLPAARPSERHFFFSFWESCRVISVSVQFWVKRRPRNWMGLSALDAAERGRALHTTRTDPSPRA